MKSKEKPIKQVKNYDPKFVAESIKQIYIFVALIPKEALEDTIKHIQQDDAIGPLLDPGRFVHSNQFEKNNRVEKRAKKLLELKNLLEEK